MSILNLQNDELNELLLSVNNLKELKKDFSISTYFRNSTILYQEAIHIKNLMGFKLTKTETVKFYTLLSGLIKKYEKNYEVENKLLSVFEENFPGYLGNPDAIKLLLNLT